MSRLVIAVTFLVVIGFCNLARAQDEPKKNVEPEQIPAPKVLQPSIIFIEPIYQRTDTRDVWQHYGVNSFGRFVPRVIQTPYGYHYSRDLQPYPWAGTRTRAIMP